MLEDMKGRPGRGCRAWCFTCCAWTFAVVFITLMILLVVGLISMALLRSTVPRIIVSSLSIHKLALSSSSGQKLLTADFNLTFEVTNKNDNVGLNIRPLTVDISSENIKIGRGKTKGFSLKDVKSHKMNAYISVVKKNIGDFYTEQFVVNIKHRQIFINVEMHGKMGIKFGGLAIKGLPLRVTCKGIYQSDFEYEDGPKCDVRLFSFS